MHSIFRQYDIRGIAGTELTDELAGDIARAFAAYARRKGQHKLLLAHDNRHSSPRLHAVMAEALLSSGADVFDLGETITPIFYFAARQMNIPGGIMITASHNGPEYNGCKLLLGESTIYGEDIQEIARMVQAREFITLRRGKRYPAPMSEAYLRWIASHIEMGPRRLKVVVDCGNGTASPFAPDLLQRLGCEVIPLYCDSDPDFPHHQPDPVDPANLRDLSAVVQAVNADLGIGFDGDGDRLGVVDARGNFLWGDMLMILFWREILPRYPGCDCIVEVKCSLALVEEILRLGGRPFFYKTGHSLIKAKMRELNTVFTGEMSGHMFFADEYYGYDDALYAAARLLRIMSHTELALDELLCDIPEYYASPEIRLPVGEVEKFTLVNEMKAELKQDHPCLDIDGVRATFDDGWALLRASNTGPEIIFRCEGISPASLERIMGYMTERMAAVEPSLAAKVPSI
ncbi:MAG: phosphomannomutase/phosphoglucomutase [Syntrophomonadaceae bacterium]|nr:phosphomannomutase/phosphoglucomutase [Syntrophomonadaceae bacterium]